MHRSDCANSSRFSSRGDRGIAETAIGAIAKNGGLCDQGPPEGGPYVLSFELELAALSLNTETSEPIDQHARHHDQSDGDSEPHRVVVEPRREELEQRAQTDRD